MVKFYRTNQSRAINIIEALLELFPFQSTSHIYLSISLPSLSLSLSLHLSLHQALFHPSLSLPLHLFSLYRHLSISRSPLPPLGLFPSRHLSVLNLLSSTPHFFYKARLVSIVTMATLRRLGACSSVVHMRY